MKYHCFPELSQMTFKKSISGITMFGLRMTNVLCGLGDKFLW